MRNRKQFHGPPHRSLRTAGKHIIQHYHMFGLWDILFVLFSIVFLVFWLLAQVLGDILDDSCYFLTFFGYLVFALGFGCLVYFMAIIYFPRYRNVKECNGEPVGLCVCMLVVIVATTGPLSLLMKSTEVFTEPRKYFATESSDVLLIHKMISNSRFWGQGESVYLYSDGLAITCIDETFKSQSLACDEQNETQNTLSIFRDEKLLVVLSYAYGSWIVIVFAIISVIWCICAFRIYLKIYSRWYEWIFFGSAISCAYHMFLPVLIAFGVMSPENLPMVFALTHGETMIMFMIPLASMLAIIKLNNEML